MAACQPRDLVEREQPVARSVGMTGMEGPWVVRDPRRSRGDPFGLLDRRRQLRGRGEEAIEHRAPRVGRIGRRGAERRADVGCRHRCARGRRTGSNRSWISRHRASARAGSSTLWAILVARSNATSESRIRSRDRPKAAKSRSSEANGRRTIPSRSAYQRSPGPILPRSDCSLTTQPGYQARSVICRAPGLSEDGRRAISATSRAKRRSRCGSAMTIRASVDRPPVDGHCTPVGTGPHRVASDQPSSPDRVAPRSSMAADPITPTTTARRAGAGSIW